TAPRPGWRPRARRPRTRGRGRGGQRWWRRRWRAGRVPGEASRPVVRRGRRLPRLRAAAVARGTATHGGGARSGAGAAAAQQPGARRAYPGSASPGHGSRMAAALASVARKRRLADRARGDLVTEQRDWPPEQSAKGTLRPWHDTAIGYLAVLFEDPQEAQRAQRGLRERGVPEGDLRLYDGEATLRIASRLQQERSILAKAIKEIEVDHRAERRWLGNARAGGSLLFLYSPTKQRGNRMAGMRG